MDAAGDTAECRQRHLEISPESLDGVWPRRNFFSSRDLRVIELEAGETRAVCRSRISAPRTCQHEKRNQQAWAKREALKAGEGLFHGMPFPARILASHCFHNAKPHACYASAHELEAAAMN